MNDAELDAAATKALRMILDTPDGAKVGLLKLLRARPDISIADLHVSFRPPRSARDHERVEAAEAAMTATWGSLKALAADRGYLSDKAIAQALGAPLVTVREMKRAGYVPRRFLLQMAAAQPAEQKPRQAQAASLAGLAEMHRRKPERYKTFEKIALRLVAAEPGQIAARRIISEMRYAKKVSLHDHLGPFYTRLFEHRYPKHRDRLVQGRGGQRQTWEEDWTEEFAEALVPTGRVAVA